MYVIQNLFWYVINPKERYTLRVMPYACGDYILAYARLHTNPSDWIKIKHFRRSALFLAPLAGLEPATCGLTVRRSTDWAKEESLCWHYLSSRAVTRQVLSAHMSLTSVFGMGTGGPSWQSIPTMTMAFKPSLYVKSRLALNARKL